MTSQLKEILAGYREAEFRYGVLDCCLFVVNVLREWKGVDYGKAWRGRYTNEFGAARIVHESGGMAGLGCALFGEIHPFWAAREGSPVLLNRNCVEADLVGESLGIFDGDVIHCLTDQGLIQAPITAAMGCWHV